MPQTKKQKQIIKKSQTKQKRKRTPAVLSYAGFKSYEQYKHSAKSLSSAAGTKTHIHHPAPEDKISIILDLDETLVANTISNKTLSEADVFPQYSTTGPHTSFIIKYQYRKLDEYVLFYARPHLSQFIDFLKHNQDYFNICIWTNSYYTYAKALVDAIFTPKFKPYLFLAREDIKFKPDGYVKGRDSKILIPSRVIYDVHTRKKYKTESHINGGLVKNLDFLFTHPDFKDKFDRNRTILIDDLPDNIAINNSENVIWVSAWNKNVYCDDVLLKLIHWLNKHKTNKSFVNVKMPCYAKDSEFNKYISSHDLYTIPRIEKQCIAKYKKKPKLSSQS